MEPVNDTTEVARRVQIEVWRRIGPGGRAQLAADLSESVREIAMDGIRGRHPEYSEDQVRHAMFRMTLGDELYRMAWPDRELLRS
jgi:hypothetical protein